MATEGRKQVARGPRPLHRAGLLAIEALLATSTICWILQAASGRAVPPVYSRGSAERALADARAAGAGAWAPWRLNEVEALLQDARLEFRRQELRFYLLRDFDDARREFRAAETHASQAADLARRRRRTREDSTSRALRTAACEVILTENLARTLSFDERTVEPIHEARRLLTHADLLSHGSELDRARLLSDRSRVEAGVARERMSEELARFGDPGNLKRWNEERERAVLGSVGSSTPALIVNKDEATLAVFVSGKLSETYDVEMGVNQLERKQLAGDKATPEGRYYVTVKKQSGETKYHKALELSYPNEEDRRRLQVLKDRRLSPVWAHPGELIEIHGEGGRGRDWTNGCISLDNRSMDELFRRVPVGTPVTVVGGDGTGGRFSTLAGFLASSGVENACAGK